MCPVKAEMDLSDDLHEEINELVRAVGFKSVQDVLNASLSLYAWCVAQSTEGRMIAAVTEDESSYRQLILPELEAIRKRSTQTEKKLDS